MHNRNSVTVTYMTFTDTITDLNVTPTFTSDVWITECERIHI